MRRIVKLLLILCVFSLAANERNALATLEQVKLYKNVFGQKPKCTSCHVDKTPKKETGKHNLNAYGKKLKAAKTEDMPDEETYKKVGKNEKADLVE